MFKLNLQLILNSLLSIFVCNGIYFTLKIHFLRKKYSHIPGPVANGIIGFYLGNLLEIKKANIGVEKFSEWFYIFKILFYFHILYLNLYYIYYTKQGCKIW
jgi:hypothetical protein